MKGFIFAVLLGGCAVMSLLLWQETRLKPTTIPQTKSNSIVQGNDQNLPRPVTANSGSANGSEPVVAQPSGRLTFAPAPRVPYYEVEIAKPDFNELAQRSTCFLFLQFHGKTDPINPQVNGVPMLTEVARMEVLSASLGSRADASHAFLAELLNEEREAVTEFATLERELR